MNRTVQQPSGSARMPAVSARVPVEIRVDPILARRSLSWLPAAAAALAVVFGAAAIVLLTIGGLDSPVAQIAAWGVAALAVLLLAAAGWLLGRLGLRGSPAGLLMAAAKSAKDALAIANSPGAIIYSNPAFHVQFGATDAGAVRSLGDIEMRIGDEAAKIAYSRLRARATAGFPDQAEIPVAAADGETRWLAVSVRPLAGEPGLSCWNWSDITESRELNRRRRREESMLSDLLGFMPVGFFSADAEGTMTFVNGVLAGWLGISTLDLTEQEHQFADFVAGDAGEIDHAMASSDASGMHGRIALRGADGESFRAYLIQSQREDQDGAFMYSRSVVLRDQFLPGEDMDDKVYLDRLPWLFSDSPIGLALLDLQGNVTDCNQAFLKLLGLHRDGVVGWPLSERINKEDRGDAMAQLSKVVMGTSPAAILDCRMPAVGERELAISLYASRIMDADGEISRLILHITDTTEHKNLELQFAQSQKMQAVGQLAGGVAHDFNNLLTAMIGFCDLLLARHPEDDPSFSDIMQVKQNANRAANLVRQLLAFSRRQTLQPKVLDITAALSDMSNLLRRLIGENIELQMEHGADVGLVRVDPGQFDQVVINLVVNARDAMPGGGLITIDSERVEIETSVQRGHEVMPAGDYVLIKVADTGSGISKEDIGHIFEPFFSTKEVGEGTGLGLSTVYGIVRQTEGFIFVDSARGEGTTFSIYIPGYIGDGSETSAEQRQASAEGASDLTGAGTVLLVEDEDSVRVFGSRALRNKGYRVLEANDGERALDVINDEGKKIDLIITDVVMPGMDGHTLVRLVREEIPEIKVILMSGYAEEAIPGKIEQNAAIHFLPKPFSLHDLAGKVKDVMEA